MNSTTRDRLFGELLRNLSDSLDITETQYLDAVKRYEAVGKWLGEEGSKLSHFKPKLFPQGSFRLGTMVKPISGADEYDLDLVCELNLEKKMITQESLKQIVGERLELHPIYSKILEQKRRCWTLNYAESTHFHMDILPAIPDMDYLFHYSSIPSNLSNESILITDTNLYHWQHSNPKGYAKWFKEQMKKAFQKSAALIAEEARIEIEEVPEYRVKTPLQRVVQLLKRHRDIMFKENRENKPISIIITTLAAKYYDDEVNIFEALTNVVYKMQNDDGIRNNEIYNPTDPSENFADKWKEKPLLSDFFIQWLEKVSSDVNSASQNRLINDMAKSMGPIFGAKNVNEAVTKTSANHAVATATHKQQAPRVVIKNPPKSWGAIE